MDGQDIVALQAPHLSREANAAHSLPEAMTIPRPIAVRPRSGPMAQPSALSAAEPDRAVLGRQYRARALCRRTLAAVDPDLHQVDRRLPHPAAVRAAAPEARLAGAACKAAVDGAAVGDRLCLRQCDFLLGHAVHASTECATDPVLRTAVRRAMVAGVVRRAPDLGPTGRHRHLAHGCADDYPAGRPLRARQHPFQQGRRDVCEFALGFRALFGADAEAAGDASIVADRVYHRLQCDSAAAALGVGILDRLYAETGCVDDRHPHLCNYLSVDAGLSVFQPRHRADRAEPRRAVLSYWYRCSARPWRSCCSAKSRGCFIWSDTFWCSPAW